MKPCSAFLQHMLDAAVDDLERPDPHTSFGRHLATCARCAAAARTILDATRALAAELDEGPDRAEADRVVEAVLAAAARRAPGAAAPAAARPAASGPARPIALRAASAPPAGPAPRPKPRIRRRDLSWLGLAAAATVAALLFRPPAIPRGPGLLVPRGEPLPGLVEAAPGADVAVLPTRDPDITVIWFFPTRSDP